MKNLEIIQIKRKMRRTFFNLFETFGTEAAYKAAKMVRIKYLKTGILLLLFVVSFTAGAQVKVKQDPAGNYVTISKPREKPVKTGKFLILTDEKLPVYRSSNGKLFVERISKKTGKKYRQYLEENH